jgi:hypothetical protein
MATFFIFICVPPLQHEYFLYCEYGHYSYEFLPGLIRISFFKAGVYEEESFVSTAYGLLFEDYFF